jgi:electron transport complex protein RnfB
MIPIAPYPENQAREMKLKAAHRARTRHQFRLQRLDREKQKQADKFVQQSLAAKESQPVTGNVHLKKAAVQAALERVLAIRAETIDQK